MRALKKFVGDWELESQIQNFLLGALLSLLLSHPISTVIQ